MSIVIDKKLVVQGTLTFVAAVACSDAIREVAVAMKRSDPTENALLRVGIAAAIILLIFIIAYLWSADDSSADSDTTDADKSPATDSQSKDAKASPADAPDTSSGVSDSSSSNSASSGASANASAGSNSASMESANVVFKRSSLPDAAITEAYADWSPYLNSFA